MNTKVFTLLSGVECEVQEMGGKEQRILTEQKQKPLGENLMEVMESIVVRIGSEQNLKKEFFTKLLKGDKSKILTEARKFSLEMPDVKPVFDFKYDYVTHDKKKAVKELSLPLDDGFPERPYMKPDPENPGGPYIPMNHKEYSEIQHEYEMTLPKSGRKIKMNLLDASGETQMANTKKDDRSSHTTILARNPREWVQKETGGGVWMQLNLDRTNLIDIEALRAEIDKREGGVDTVILFEHPEAEKKAPHEREVKIDLLLQTAFFFPSGVVA